MAGNKSNIHTINTIVIIILGLMLVAVIWIPKNIWDDEARMRQLSQSRMVAVNTAEKAFYVLSESYTPDLDVLFDVVNGVYDSVRRAEADTNYTFVGEKSFIFPQAPVTVNVTPEYAALYAELHRQLFEKLEPNHYLPAESIGEFIEAIRSNFKNGNYTGTQSLKIGTDSLKFTVPERFDILYQNAKFRMFNVLTGSATKDEKFANPLVDAVLDTLRKNENLRGELTFHNLYNTIQFEYTVDPEFAGLLEESKIKLRKFIKFSESDSITFGERIYAEAVETVLSGIEIPIAIEVHVLDSLENDTALTANIDFEGMQKGINDRLNTLYKKLSGNYKEPNYKFAQLIIDIVADSIKQNPNFMGVKNTVLDLSDVAFTVNINPSIPLNQVKFNRDIYVQLRPRLFDMDLDAAAASLVELVADTLRKRNDQVDWQVYQIPQDRLNVKIPAKFLRAYDNMNMELFQNLTGNFDNVNTRVNTVIRQVANQSAIDTIDFTGSQIIPLDTVNVNVTVKPDYIAFYDSIFVNKIDTVVEFSDSSFIGVWARGTANLAIITSPSELPFIDTNPQGLLVYHAGKADSVREYHLVELESEDRTEKAYLNDGSFVVQFKSDSSLTAVYQVDATGSDTTALTYTVVSSKFIVGIQEKQFIMEKDSFATWVDTTVAQKFKKTEKNYPYKLTDEMKYDSVTGQPFRVTVRNQVNLRIEAPYENKTIKTRRYLVFTQKDTTAGRIIDGELSWSTQ